jgi:hypothetical protein
MLPEAGCSHRPKTSGSPGDVDSNSRTRRLLFERWVERRGQRTFKIEWQSAIFHFRASGTLDSGQKLAGLSLSRA